MRLHLHEFDPTDGVVDPLAGGEPEPTADSTPTEPEWVGPSREEWEGMQQHVQRTGQVLQNLDAVLQQGPPPTEPFQQHQQPEPAERSYNIDPFNPQTIQDAIKQEARAQAEELFRQQFSQYEPVLGAWQADQGERLAREELTRVKDELKNPALEDDAVLLITAGIAGAPGVDPRDAVGHAARYMNDYEQRIRQDERAKYKAELEGLRDAPRDLPANTAPANPLEKIPTGPDRYRQAVANWRSRHNPTMPVG